MQHPFHPNIAGQSRGWAGGWRIHAQERHLHLQTLYGFG
jgi:hypothetical protein